MVEIRGKELERIEHHLRLAEREWPRLPEMEARIAGREPDEAEALILEFDVEDEGFEDLKKEFGKGAMTEKQASRFKRLENLVAENTPILQRLRRS